jgi:hypothetical protein
LFFQRKAFIFFLFLSAILSCTSRGIFEILIGKTAGYGLQITIWTGFLASLLIISRGYIKTSHGMMFLYLLLGFAAFSSSLITLDVRGFEYGIIYAVAMMYISGLILYGIAVRLSFFEIKTVIDSFIPVTCLLIGIGVAQEVGAINLPGGSGLGFVRPSSLTGSYLHYPIVIAILALIFGQAAFILRKWRYAVMSILCVSAVIISASRSGAMILGLSGALWVVFFLSSMRTVRKFDALMVVLILIAMSCGGLWALSDNFFVKRILSSTDLTSAGNDDRLYLWKIGFDVFTDGPILLGKETGLYTNITSNIAGTTGGIVESGLLQQLVNFGLIGTIAFYGLYIGLFYAVDKNCRWLRAAVLASLMQSFIYQSIEVFPFIALVAFLPTLSHALSNTLYKIE